MSQSRQLAAIMFTDIVGYTKLMGEDEQKAFQTLKKNRSVQRPIVEKFGGKWLKEIGDGVLASFSTVSDAVYCAKEIQKTCQNEPDLNLRIGIHQGEVVFEGSDVFGDGVNIASRIQSITPPGGIYVSESVFRNVENKQDIGAVFIGERKLKNVRHPIKIFRISEERQEQDYHLDKFRQPKISAEKSIAVLPFINMSSDPEQEYFSDGLTEEVITDLSQLKDLLVISRSSVMTFKGTKKHLKEIAAELDVRYVLEGSVRKAGNNLRITAQLIDAQKDSHIWAEKYSGIVDNIFEIQEDVSRSIVECLNIELNPSENLRLSNRPIKDPHAYELYQKAQYEIFQFKEDSLKRGVQYLYNASDIEKDNPFIYSKIGSALLSTMNSMNWLDRSILKKVRQLTTKVFELAPNSPMGHVLLGYLGFYEGNIKDAIFQIQTAYDSNPNDYDNLWLLILGYSYLGQSDQAERYTNLMEQVDPYSPIFNTLKALMLYMKGDFPKGLDEINIAYKLYPEVPQVQLYYAYYLMIEKKEKQAILILELFISNTVGSIFSVMGELFKAAILNNADPDLLLTKENEEKLKVDVEWCWLLADFYSIMNRSEKALDWLEQAINRGFINYPLLAFHDPFLENIRKNNRFLSLMDRVKLQHEELLSL